MSDQNAEEVTLAQKLENVFTELPSNFANNLEAFCYCRVNNLFNFIFDHHNTILINLKTIKNIKNIFLPLKISFRKELENYFSAKSISEKQNIKVRLEKITITLDAVLNESNEANIKAFIAAINDLSMFNRSYVKILIGSLLFSGVGVALIIYLASLLNGTPATAIIYCVVILFSMILSALIVGIRYAIDSTIADSQETIKTSVAIRTFFQPNVAPTTQAPATASAASATPDAATTDDAADDAAEVKNSNNKAG